MSADDPFLGEIIAFTGNFPPVGWALCNGQILPISQYTALFSLLGTTYGGDGKSNFALPNLQSRVVMGAGNGNGLTPRVEGETDGVETVALLASQLPLHSHALDAATTGDAPVPQGRLAAPSRAGDNSYGADTGHIVSMNGAAVSPAGSVSPQVHDNVQPFLVVNYIIAMQGIFPARS